MRKSIVSILIALFLTINFFAANAQTAAKDNAEKNNRIGISGSMISGWGLSYQHNFDPLAVKLIAFYYLNKSGDGTNSYNQVDIIGNPFDFNDKQNTGSFGIELKYFVMKSKYVNLYPFLGFGYWFDYNESLSTNYKWENNVQKIYTYKRRDYFDSFNGGIGFGIELLAGKHLAFNFDMGIDYKKGPGIYDDYSYPPKEIKYETMYIGIAVGGGISFAF